MDVTAEANKGAPEARNFIRHPCDIPIHVELGSVVSSRKEYLLNIGGGGLCFRSHVSLPKGTLISIRIPLVKPIFKCEATVVWCEDRRDHYDVGVQFGEARAAFRLRMVEQICHIEQYKREINRRDGRELTSEEAALEWIEKFAADFPQIRPL